MTGPKIVLLTDFSDLSLIAIRFAVKMAAQLDATFTILNIIRLNGIPKANLKLKQIEKALTTITEEEGHKLVEDLTRQIKGNYKIKFKAVKAHTVAEMVTRFTEKNPTHMVVMGSRGASAIKKARLGGTTVSVIDDCKVPVLAIPDSAHYKDLKQIVYATDFKYPQKELDIIIEFAEIFGSHVHVIHVASVMDKHVEADKIAFEKLIEKLPYHNKVDFKLILDDDIPGAIDSYIKETKADLLTTFTHHLSLTEKLFSKSVTRKLAYLGTIPLLAVKRK